MVIFVWLLQIDSETQFCPTTFKRLIWVKVAIFACYLELTHKRSVGYDKLCKKSDLSKNELKIIFLFPTLNWVRNAVFDTIKCLTTLKDMISVKTDKNITNIARFPELTHKRSLCYYKMLNYAKPAYLSKNGLTIQCNFRFSFRLDAETQFGLVRNV